MEEQLGSGEETIRTMTAELEALADVLSKKRAAGAERMEKQLLAELKQLGFQKAEFSVAINQTLPKSVITVGMTWSFLFLTQTPAKPHGA
jgi:DNA repair ATPase RecN